MNFLFNRTKKAHAITTIIKIRIVIEKPECIMNNYYQFV